MLEELAKLGLYEDEAKVYLACLELGGGYASAIAKRAGVHRVTCYHTLENLIQKGLVSVSSQHNTKFFQVESPELLVRQQADKLQVAEKILPHLKSLILDHPYKPNVRFVEGIEGIKAVFEETLETADEIVGYTNVSNLVDLFPDFLHYYAQERMKRRIKSRFLSPYCSLAKTFLSTYFPEDEKREIAEILYVDPNQFQFENEIYVYGNKVATLSLNENEMIGVVVESPIIAKTHRSVFDLSWLGATSFVA